MHAREASDEGSEGENERGCSCKGVDDFAKEREISKGLRRVWGGEENERGASEDKREEKEKSGSSPDKHSHHNNRVWSCCNTLTPRSSQQFFKSETT